MAHDLILCETHGSQEHALAYNCWNYPVKVIDQVTGQGKQHGKPANKSVHLSQWFRYSTDFQNDRIMPWKKWMKTQQ